MDSRKILKALEKDGWHKVNQVGSHVQLKHPAKKGRVTVKHPAKSFPKKTIRSIEKQSGVRLL